MSSSEEENAPLAQGKKRKATADPSGTKNQQGRKGCQASCC